MQDKKLQGLRGKGEGDSPDTPGRFSCATRDIRALCLPAPLSPGCMVDPNCLLTIYGGGSAMLARRLRVGCAAEASPP